MKHVQFLFLISFLFLAGAIYAENKNWLDPYDVVWDAPSKNASESMPLGGGDIGCNVWVENGNLMLYMQRSGCFSENGEYLKLGRIRLDFTPNPFKEYAAFNQTLQLEDGSIRISSKGKNKDNGFDLSLKLWVDIFTHSIHVEIDAQKEIAVKASYESWRTADRELTDENRGRFGCFGLEGYPGTVIKKKDNIAYQQDAVLFYHRNDAETQSPTIMIEQQGLSAYKDRITNNISQLTFGGLLYGTHFTAGETAEGVYCGTPYKSWSIKSNSPAKSHQLVIATHKAQTKTIEQWESGLQKSCNDIRTSRGNKKKNQEWWASFWDRSRIITDPQQKDADSTLWQIGRNYQLMRYQLACNLYGDYPSKFNGGNFIFDPVLVNPKMQHDPDWRQWGGDVFTAQNQRLLYWPMLKSGDFDGMHSQFNLYQEGLPGAILKVQTAFGHRGALFCEYANAAGLDMGSAWGWDGSKIRQRGKEVPFGDASIQAINSYFEPVEKGVIANGSIAYHWESQVEHAYMMLEYNRFSNKNIDAYIPFIKNALIFFDEHYQKRQEMRNGKKLDENGKLVFFPSTSCESYRGAKNPADLISGIRSCLESLIALQSDSLSTADKAYFREYLDRLPDLSFGVADNGDRIVKPAESYLKYQNVECPQFYPLFPFNRFDIQDPIIPTFRNTWEQGNFPKNMVISWHQDGIFYARMGMVDEAYRYNLRKLKDSERRFPTFWGPGHDWVPDHNWGGSGMIGLQEMLLQTVGDKLFILPCWPKDKDVSFKLHAPGNTTVEVVYKKGKIETMNIFPLSRSKDVVVCLNN